MSGDNPIEDPKFDKAFDERKLALSLDGLVDVERSDLVDQYHLPGLHIPKPTRESIEAQRRIREALERGAARRGRPDVVVEFHQDEVGLTRGCSVKVKEAEEAAPKITIQVYLNNGVVREYDVASIATAREHAFEIIRTGYRSVDQDEPTTLTHWPPHEIKKVKIKASAPIQTNYFDRAQGT